MIENVELPDRIPHPDRFDWACDGINGRGYYNDLTTCGDGPDQWEQFNLDLQAKFNKIKENEFYEYSVHPSR